MLLLDISGPQTWKVEVNACCHGRIERSGGVKSRRQEPGGVVFGPVLVGRGITAAER